MPRWVVTTKADQRPRLLADRHYTRQSPGHPMWTRPGWNQILYLEQRNGRAAVFCWWRPKWESGIPGTERKDGLRAIECALFRNETRLRSSDLIRAAVEMVLKWEHATDVEWPDGLITGISSQATAGGARAGASRGPLFPRGRLGRVRAYGQGEESGRVVEASLGKKERTMKRCEVIDSFPGGAALKVDMEPTACVVRGEELIAITFGDPPGMEKVVAQLIADFFNKRSDECEAAGAKYEQERMDAALTWMFQGGAHRFYHHRCMRLPGEHSIEMSTLRRLLYEGLIEERSREQFCLTSRGLDVAKELFHKAPAQTAGTRTEPLEDRGERIDAATAILRNALAGKPSFASLLALWAKRKATVLHIDNCATCQAEIECLPALVLMREEDAILRQLDREK